IVKGTVSAVDAKSATIALNDEVEAVLKASEISRDKVEDARNALNEGDEVEAKIISIDRKNRLINLSVKSKDVEDDKQALEGVRAKAAETSGATTIGDLIKEQMQQQNANKE
ncbi:MAG: S1 RNA-binding domain-containing protein, partial [Pseudomonadota bacterium]|nr:S1 RNA-binding domain-containing protein [Pseudomonadota bacterium]